MALGMEVGLCPRHIVLDGDPALLLKKGAEPPPSFGPFYCCQTAGCIKMPLGMEVGLSPGDFVLDGDPVPLPKKGRRPQFSAHVYCGQTAAWIKMRHCVRWGPSFPSPKGTQLPIFGYCPLWQNGWMN